MAQGKVSFSLIQALGERLTRLAESTLLSYAEGSSKIKRGKSPKWLLGAIDFQLTGITKGSTILSIEAPRLEEHIKNIQLPLFQDLDTAELGKNTALDLSFFAYEQALNNQEDSFLLDKNLLKELSKFQKLLQTDGATLSFESNSKQLEINRKTLSEIKVLEEKTPAGRKAKVTGMLDVLQHSKSQLELLVAGKKMRARLAEQIHLEEVLELFGKEVTVSGMANFNPAGKITSFEIQNIRQAAAEDDYFRTLPQPIFQELHIQDIAKRTGYRGTDLSKVLGQWPGEESTDELLELLR